MPDERPVTTTRVGRYTLHHAVASGGMATVHIGRMDSAAGVRRTVAIKRVHAQFASDPEFVSMFFDEARLSLRIQHPHVVPTFDVVAESGELLLVMDYVHGDSLASLVHGAARRREPVPGAIASAILGDVLAGLHAAHELRGEDGRPLGIVHRDVSPQNILVGVDGSARVLDFGVAKASGRQQSTEQGKIKGKIAYMAPEQLVAGPLDRRADVFAASVVLWEILTGVRLFDADGPGAVAIAVLSSELRPPSALCPALGPAVDRVVMTGLARHVDARYPSAEAMAIELERALPPATTRAVGEWVQRVASETLASRARLLTEVETGVAGRVTVPAPAGRAGHLEAVASGVDELPSELHDLAPVAAVTVIPTQLSTSVGASEAQEPRARGWRLAGMAALPVAAVALALLVRAESAHPSVAASAPAAPRETPAETRVSPDPSVRAAPPLEAPSATGTASAPPPPPVSARPSAERPRVGSPRPQKPAVAPDCTNPFVVDSKGIRVPRPECF